MSLLGLTQPEVVELSWLVFSVWATAFGIRMAARAVLSTAPQSEAD